MSEKIIEAKITPAVVLKQALGTDCWGSKRVDRGEFETLKEDMEASKRLFEVLVETLSSQQLLKVYERLHGESEVTDYSDYPNVTITRYTP